MKNHFLENNRRLFAIWAIFFLSIILSFGLSLILSPNIKFSTSLFDILPPSSALSEVQKADSLLAEKTGRTITILVQNQNFEEAKKDAEELYSIYVPKDSSGNSNLNTDFFEELSLFVGDESMQQVMDWIYEWKFNLLDADSAQLLQNGGAEEFQEESLSRIFGGFSISDFSQLEEDPFLLSEKELSSFLTGGALSSTAMLIKDGVLACQKDEKWYVLLRGTVSKSGSSLTSKKSTVKSLYKNCKNLEKAGTSRFIFSGVPFHSYDNSSSAQKQISIISTVGMILILVAFFVIFKSFFPALVSSLAVLFSCGIGFVSVLLFFRGIHVLTFVFGTTLIGTCLDYSIHFFINWKYNRELKNGLQIRKHIFKGVGLGFLSTEICFLCLLLSPFPLLKQVGVFLFTGLAFSFLNVICLYPLFKMPEIRADIEKRKHFSFEENFRKANFKKAKSIFLILFSVVLISVIFIKRENLKIYNNISTLYSMTGKMMENEKISASVLNTGSSGWYFIVKADSEENLLQKNEMLDEILEKAIADGKLESYLSLTQFLHSKKRQKTSYDSLRNLIPLVDSQYEFLDFPAEYASSYKRSFESHDGKYFELNDLPQTILSAIKSIYIGEIDGEYYTCVMPLHVKSEEEAFFREFASNTQGVYFVNKVKDISLQLDLLSKSMLSLLALAFCIIVVILFFLYKPVIVLKIASVPLLVMAVTVCVLLIAGIPLSFFPITSIILVFGLGLDYIIYKIEGLSSKEKAALNDFAIFLSFVTTALSFGALSLSSFPPVHLLGLTVFVGLVTAVFGAFAIINKENTDLP